MSKTRIVKGNITKITGGNYKIYSKENIENIGLKIIQIGKEGGVSYGYPEKYVPPPLNIVESHYKLESHYAHEQLMSLAQELGEVTFMLFMSHIFGYEIEVSALSKLYRALCDKQIESPEIVVSKIPVGRRLGLAGYSNKRKKIIVYERLIEEALDDNDKRAELLAALVEEYGHHIDNLLRTEFASENIKDTDVIDEGLKFAYQLFQFDIFKEYRLNFAKAELPQFKGDLIVDFSILHKKVIEYVNESRHYDEDPTDDISNYGAGRNRKHNKMAAFAHGDIEFEALVKKDLYGEKEVSKIYYGNWLRDMSQVIVKITVRITNEGIKNKEVAGKVNPVKFSHNTWVALMKILAIKEFIYDPQKEGGESPKDDYKTLEVQFKKEFGDLTKDVLGIYRPEEHIDNPYGLPDESDAKDDKGQPISFMYERADGSKIEKKLYLGAKNNPTAWLIDPKRNMSNFFWNDHKIFPRECPSSVTYMKEQIKLACKKRETKEGFRHLGAALHVLEDFFSHTNFVEISLRRLGVNAYPWVSYAVNEKDHTKIPVVSGRFLTDDTVASIGPKAGDLLFAPEVTEYKRRIPGQRTLSEKFIESILTDLAKGQESDYIESNKNYKGLSYSTWLDWFKKFLKFQDFLASQYQKSDNQKWMSKDFFEKLGSKATETFQKSTSYVGQAMAFFPKLAFNLLLGSLDEVVPEIQSLTIDNYGYCPSHSQIAKDSYTHPLNKISATLAKHAVEDVGRKYKSGMDANSLAEYVAQTYFVHPSSPNARWSDEKYLIKWVDSQSKEFLSKLKNHTIYEHTHQEAKDIGDKSIKKMKEIIDFFDRQTK